MSVVWSGICAVAALAAAAQRVQGTGEGSQMRTKVLPGHGYIRYEVLPGDEETEPGELIVVHEERRPAPSPSPEAVQTQSPAPVARRDEKPCSELRAKLVARLFEVQGLQVEPEFAEWLERNLTMGGSHVKTILIEGGTPQLLTALQVDGVARGLAEDLARCERRSP